ncbi:chromatin assembly factor 1 subunit A-domain-containing protein [Mycena sp. CBHHK59/15]|nr:chromatin assembly factor 1 subunit A-domain-containing protein [Mycena sp. CBHHK59/15]
MSRDALTDIPNASNAGGTQGKSSIVELKNGKVLFKQKPMSFEKHSETLQEIVKFREMLEERNAKRATVLTAITDEHKPVIAKLAHESDKTLSALSKHILQELLPVQDEDDDPTVPPPLTLAVVEGGIKSIVSRNNYGLDGIGGTKAPAAVCVWRWEVKPAFLDWLPKNATEKAENRIAERAQAKLDLRAMFDSLSQEEQDTILDPKGTGKAPAKDGTTATGFHTIDLTGDELKTSPQTCKKKEDEENDSNTGPKVGRAKKIADSEKIAKEKEKLEKKVAKAEKEQKEKEAQNKSRSLMKSFFKAGPAPRASPSKASESKEATSSSHISQFEKTFKPFVLKKDTTLAPVNWFRENQKTRRRSPLTYEGDVIVIDDGEYAQSTDVAMEDADVAKMSAQECLRSTLQSLPPPLRPYRVPTRAFGSKPPAAHLKTTNNLSVRDIVGQLTEAEVAGDIGLVRSLSSKLSDRSLLPAKVLIFADDARPGYFGTWTRNSRIIGPRTPFVKDVTVFDYGYDSGEEWDEEPSGDADDVIEDGEEEDGEPDDADSDLDSWLVDDEDEPGNPVEERGVSPAFPALHAPSAKRKAEGEDSKLAKKRKVVVPLVPFAKGPFWEKAIGRCDYDTFEPYRIQLFNNTPFPINPFTFVSECGDVKRASKKDVFAVPSLPDRLIVATPPSRPDLSPPIPSTLAKRTAAPPKTVFPDIHLAHLLDKISSAQIASLPILVDAIYQELRDQKVKKNSIEAKVREVAEKCRVKKIWIVKDSFRVAASEAA